MHPIANEIPIGIQMMFGKSQRRERFVHGVGKILQGIDERSVEIKNGGFKHRAISRPGGLFPDIATPTHA